MNVKETDMNFYLYENLSRHRGSINEIAERIGRHRNWVRLVLKGVFQSNEVLEVAAKVLLEREQAAASQRARVREIVSQVRQARAVSM